MEIKMSLIAGNKSGKAGKISVKAGDFVEKGTVLVQIETGKGNREIKAGTEGVIIRVLIEEGDEILSEQVLFELEEQLSADNLDSKNPTVQEQINTDLLIIGGGPGGYVAAIYAAQNGLDVTLVEKNKLGGTCLNVGCIPTKALIKSAEVYQQICHSEEFGILTEGTAKPDMSKILARKDRIVHQLVDGVEDLMQKNHIRLIRGKASFISEQTVLAIENGKRYEITAKDIIIATGSKISNFHIPGIELPFVRYSDQMLSDTELPESLVILGGGIVGMEFAFAYQRFGAKVSVVKRRDQLFSVKDDEVMKVLRDETRKAGIDVYTGARIKEIRQTEDGQGMVIFEDNAGEHSLLCDKVLVTTGREANLDGLDYEKAGVLYDKERRGIAVDTHMRTNQAHIYAIGDVTNILQLAHVASHQGMIAVKNILGEDAVMDYDAVPEVVFTAPEVASVGEGETSLKNQGRAYQVGRFSFDANGKALTAGEGKGFLKLLSDEKSGKLIGATVIGADASTLISTVTVAIRNGLTARQLAETIFAHPTTAEVIHEAALDLGLGAIHQ